MFKIKEGTVKNLNKKLVTGALITTLVMSSLTGCANTKDFEYEREIADVNLRLGGIETVLLISEPEHASTSSSIVRELITYGKDVSELLP